MSNKLSDSQIADLAIEDLMDSSFISGKHEAYAYITDRYSQLSEGRIGGAMLQLINGVNWDYVEGEVRRLQKEMGTI